MKIWDIIKKLSKYCSKYSKGIAFTIICGILGALFNLRIPMLINNISNNLQSQIGVFNDFQPLLIDMFRAGFDINCIFIFNFIYNRNLEGYSQKIGSDIRFDINQKINRLSFKEIDKIPAGELVVMSSVDVENIITALSKGAGPLFINAILLLGAVVIMLIKSPLLALAVIACAVIGNVVTIIISKKLLPMKQRQLQELAKMNMQIDETISGYNIIKAYNNEEEICRQFEENNKIYSTMIKRTQFLISGMTPLISFINNFTYLLICVLGAYMIKAEIGNVTVGVIVSFIFYTRIMATPLSFFAGITGILSMAIVSSDKIFGLLNKAEKEDEGRNKIKDIKGRVTFRDVRFGYRDDTEIIHGFSADISPGMKVAIVGPTGAGKSTIINLLNRFYELNSGSIQIDGVDITSISRKDLHNYIGMVLQDTFIFNGTIKENIVFATQNYKEEDLERVIKDCFLDHLIQSFEEKSNKVLSEKTKVSSGQKQLITIARAMLKDPSILILDEATSAVDSRTELMVQKALDTITKGRTCFVIAHHLSTIKNADLIFVLKDGDIVETGNHDELIKKGGFYSELYYSQFETA